MSVSKKLFLGFSIVICLAMVVGVIGIAGMQRLQRAGVSMYENQVHSLEYVGRAATEFREIRRMFNQVVTNSWYDDKKGALDAKKKYEAHTAEFLYLLEESYKAASTSETDEFSKLYTRIMELFNDETVPLFNDAIDACIYDIPDHYNKLNIRVKMSKINKTTDQIEKLILGMMDLNSAVAKKTSLDNTATTQLLIIIQAVLLVFVVITAVIVAFFVTRVISNQVHWYQSILDCIPMPLSITDMQRRTTFINKPAEALLQIKRNDILGTQCSDVWNANICGTENCGIMSALRGVTLTQFSENDKDYLVNASVLKGRNNTDAGFIEVVNDISEIARLHRKTEEQNRMIMSGIKYASKIQKNLLPLSNAMENAFSDCSVIWKPRDIVGGDIYWMKKFNEGTVLCVADCTGHGTSGALLTMLVVSALEAVVGQENCHDTAGIIWRLEQRLVDVFSVKADGREISDTDILDGCDLAVLFIANDGNVISSAGHTNVFVCDGKVVRRIKGQKIYVGEGRLNSKDEIETVHIPADPNNKFYIASDGLFDQPGGIRCAPFGYRRFEEIILKSHVEKQSVISGEIWEAFEAYRGAEPRVDDFELITFKP